MPPWLDCPAFNAIIWVITVTITIDLYGGIMMQGDIMTGDSQS